MNQQLRAQLPFLGFDSQHPHGNLKPSVSGADSLFWLPFGTACKWCTDEHLSKNKTKNAKKPMKNNELKLFKFFKFILFI